MEEVIGCEVEVSVAGAVKQYNLLLLATLRLLNYSLNCVGGLRCYKVSFRLGKELCGFEAVKLVYVFASTTPSCLRREYCGAPPW